MAKGTFFKDFKDFISKGNIVDMATGVIIGGAFSKIVSSLVNDVIMPPISVLLGNVNFTELKYVLKEEVLNEAGEVAQAAISINYGNFIQLIIDFLLMAFCVFLVLRVIVKSRARLEAKKKQEEAAVEAAPAPIPEDILLLREIRDSLKNKKD
jgi:large conductance mechanosensitive channel